MKTQREINMSLRSFKQVDVFTAKAYFGNPLGVVLDGTGLSQVQMQYFTNWTNLSEPIVRQHFGFCDFDFRVFTHHFKIVFWCS